MNAVKRLFVSMKAQINSVVEDLENHEGLATAAIQEVETAVAKIHTQGHRLQRQIQTLEAKIKEAANEAERWSLRAVEIQAHDKGKALECVRRLRAVQQFIERLERDRGELFDLKFKLDSELEKLTAHLDGLKRRKEQLVARQNKADAIQLIDMQRSDSPQTEDVFERWETRITASEYSLRESFDIDPLASEFTRSEEQRDLELTLEQLIQAAHDAQGVDTK